MSASTGMRRFVGSSIHTTIALQDRHLERGAEGGIAKTTTRGRSFVGGELGEGAGGA